MTLLDLENEWLETVKSAPGSEAMKEAIYNYVVYGRPVGNFLEGVLSNDFCLACFYADDDNVKLLLEWARFIHNELPWAKQQSWGSLEIVRAWQNGGGLIGLYRRKGELEAA